jgi:hypothetical protein
MRGFLLERGVRVEGFRTVLDTRVGVHMYPEKRGRGKRRNKRVVKLFKGTMRDFHILRDESPRGVRSDVVCRVG